MSLLLGDMLVRYRADITDLSVKTAMATGEIDSFSSGAKVAGMAVAGALVATGAAIIGIGVLSTKMAADFQQSTNLLITSAGEIPGNIDMIRKGLLQMSVDTATSTDDLVKGMFNVESAGYRGADALMVEKAAAEGAKVENADLAAVTDVLTTAMHNYHLPASQAVDVMNSMRMSASQGKMHMDDLTAALTNVLPVASQAKVSLSNVEAALSTMTQSGDRGAAAGTHLAQMLIYLENPAPKATKLLKELGLTTQQISDEMKVSLPGAIEMITHAVGEKFPVGSAKYIAALSTISGGNKSARAMFELSGASANDFIKNLGLLGPTMKANSTAVDGWDTVQSNANFTIGSVVNSVKALLIVLGTQLLPKVIEAGKAIIPLIVGFTKWLMEGDRLKNTIIQVSNTLTTIGNVIGGVVSGFASFVGWLQQGSPLATAVGIALLMIAGGFAAIQIGAFIAAVPAIVGGFIAWSVAAWSAAIATIAATWPIFLIGAAVVLVVALIVIAVKNWGAISHWLVGAWKAAIGWLGGALNSIGQFFVGVWNWIKNATTAAWNFIVNAVKIGVGIFLAVLLGPFIAIGALFIWLYNHNTYVKQLVDSIVGFVKAGMAWLTNAFESAFQWVVNKLNWFKDMNVAAFNMVYGTIKTVLNAVYGFVVGIVSTILGFFRARWDELVFTVTYLWQKISNIFSSAWNTYIAGPLGKIQTGVTNWFSGLVNGALNAGKNFINMLVQGITSGAGAIWNAVSGVAKTIWKALGFKSPTEEGPGKDSDKWMPNLIKMLVGGLNAGVSPVQKAAQQVAAPLQGQFQYPIRPSAVAVAAASQNTSRSSDQQVIIVEFDGTEITRKIMTKADRLVRLKIGANGRAA